MVTNKRYEGKIINWFYLWMTYSSLRISRFDAAEYLYLPEDTWFEFSREKVQAETWSQSEDTERQFLLGQRFLIFKILPS